MERQEIINLVENAKDGCQKSYSLLYQKYFPQTRAYCASLLRKNWNDEEVQDLTAEVMAKALCKLHLYKGQWYLTVWIKAIAVNTRRDALRKLQVQTHQLVSLNGNRKVYGIESGVNADSQMLCSDIYSIIKKVIAESNPKHIPILEGRYLKEKTYSEISRENKIPIPTLSSVLSRKKVVLRSMLLH